MTTDLIENPTPLPMLASAEAALAALDAAARTVGLDHIYSGTRAASCLYVDGDGGPSCLVGHALLAAGVAAEDLAAHNHDEIGLLLDKLGYEAAPMAYAVLKAAQHEQDHGKPWGFALRVAAFVGDLDASPYLAFAPEPVARGVEVL